MSSPVASVIIPTHNRQTRIVETLERLLVQTIGPDAYELIVVDDGSTPPISLPERSSPLVRLVRTKGVERSAARNAGAEVARGELLIFIDDDIDVAPDFVQAHVEAQRSWPGTLVVGDILLPEEERVRPFVRFRQSLELQSIPRARGITEERAFCAAGNMSIARGLFLELGGFDPALSSSEDQDLALRHTARGGKIAYLPEASVVHCDNALDIRSYCKRSEWGSAYMVPFCQRYPELPANVEREHINGPPRWGQEPLGRSVRKALKGVVATAPVLSLLFGLSEALERAAPESRSLERIYRLLLGGHLVRGYRRGLKRSGAHARTSAVKNRLERGAKG